MKMSQQHPVGKAVDDIQQCLVNYAFELNYVRLPFEVTHAAKLLIIDTLGALLGGFFGEPCHIARKLAAAMPARDGATIIGSRMRTTPDMAAFVNGVTARYVEMNDVYHIGFHGHPSDIIAPILSAAEYAQASGRDFLAGIVLGYEVYLRICDVFDNHGFDNTIFGGVATAVAAGKLFGLTRDQLSHCISMAIVPNNILRQSRTGHLTMFKALACAHMGRAGVFAAMLARAGMEGPHLPFEGAAGWCDHVARKRFSLDVWGGNAARYRILDTLIKIRPADSFAISAVLAAEKVPRIANLDDVMQVHVETVQYGKDRMATGEHHWNPDSRETADHSIPYVIAATLMDGTVTSRSYNDAHIRNPVLKKLLHKIDVVANEKFTNAYDQSLEHRTRVTVITRSGERLSGESGGDEDDIGAPKSDAQIEKKFRGLAEDLLGSRRVNDILDRLWHLDDVKNVAEITHLFVLD